MSDQSLLCKCTFCLDENVNGVLLNRNIYNRHYLRIQEYSVRDENLEYMDLQTEENMNLHAKENMSSYAEEDMNLYAEEDMNLHAEENMNLQEDNLNLVNENSDTESFNFNEEDNEYYSDYNNDDDDNDDNDDDDDNNNDNNNDDNDDNDAICVDDKTNISIEELKLLHLKSLYNFTESA